MFDTKYLENISKALEKFSKTIEELTSSDKILKSINEINKKIEQTLNKISKFDLEKFVNELERLRIKEETIESYAQLVQCLIKDDNYTFFRGEDSSNYKLIPSIYRKREINIKKYDYSYLKGKYINISSFLKKRINYRFLSMTQHYGLSSPFIDFTKNPFIALYFAIYNKNSGLIELIENDVAVYKVRLLNKEQYITKLAKANELIKEYNVEYVLDFEDKSLEDYEGVPDSYFIDIPTNDRIEIQQGLFLYLNNFMLLKEGFYCTKLNDDALITKYIIPKEIINQNIDDLNLKLEKYMYIYDVEKYLKNKL